MKGAHEYATLFKSGQHGKLFFVSGSHARGKTFQIWVLPSADSIEPKNPWSVDGAVEVYGVVAGNPGWTESYGWLHKGKWCDDFNEIVATKKAEIADKQARLIAKREAEEFAKQQAIKNALANY